MSLPVTKIVLPFKLIVVTDLQQYIVISEAIIKASIEEQKPAKGRRSAKLSGDTCFRRVTNRNILRRACKCSSMLSKALASGA